MTTTYPQVLAYPALPARQAHPALPDHFDRPVHSDATAPHPIDTAEEARR